MGYCCEVGENCPTGITTYDPRYKLAKNWCSDYNKNVENVPLTFKYMVCPNEPACGDNGNKFITPALNGEVLRRDINRYDSTYKFVDGDICAFIIKNPVGMGVKDWMWLEISQVTQS